MNRYKIKKLIILAVSMGIVMIIINNLSEIITWANQVLKANNINIYAIDKYFYYLRIENVSNGRDLIWEQSRLCINRSPIFGNGIGYFEMISGGSRAHNIFVQSMCEGGLRFGIG